MNSNMPFLSFYTTQGWKSLLVTLQAETVTRNSQRQTVPTHLMSSLHWLTYTLNMHQWTWQQHRLKLFPISHNHNPQWPNTVTVPKNINHQSDWWHILKQQNINLSFIYFSHQICSSNYRDESRRIIRQLNCWFLMLFFKNNKKNV